MTAELASAMVASGPPAPSRMRRARLGSSPRSTAAGCTRQSAPSSADDGDLRAAARPERVRQRRRLARLAAARERGRRLRDREEQHGGGEHACNAPAASRRSGDGNKEPRRQQRRGEHDEAAQHEIAEHRPGARDPTRRLVVGEAVARGEEPEQEVERGRREPEVAAQRAVARGCRRAAADPRRDADRRQRLADTWISVRCGRQRVVGDRWRDAVALRIAAATQKPQQPQREHRRPARHRPARAINEQAPAEQHQRVPDADGVVARVEDGDDAAVEQRSLRAAEADGEKRRAQHGGPRVRDCGLASRCAAVRRRGRLARRERRGGHRGCIAHALSAFAAARGLESRRGLAQA